MSDKYGCDTCGKQFPAGWQALDDHLRSTGHHSPSFECDTCPRYFASEQARQHHMNALYHWGYDDSNPGSSSRWECWVCGYCASTESDVIKHEHEKHLYCSHCGKGFVCRNDLQQHLRSAAHQDAYAMPCPFCRKRFQMASSVAGHVESGSCPQAQGLSRDDIFNIVRSKDPTGAITNEFLIGWYGSVRYQASELAYNCRRGGWECYLCHRLFATVDDLNQHLNSPAHYEPLYHCPNRKCGRQFVMIAALFNHLESESCGHTRFVNVQLMVQGVLTGDRLLKF